MPSYDELDQCISSDPMMSGLVDVEFTAARPPDDSVVVRIETLCVGMRHHRRPAAITTSIGSDCSLLSLKREPGNAFDANAIQVAPFLQGKTAISGAMKS